MSRRVELEIRNLLIEHEELDRVADEILKRWSAQHYVDEDTDAVAQFLLNCGLYPSLLDKITLQISKKHKVMWPYYAEVLGNSAVEVDMKILDAIIEGAKEQNLTLYLARSSALDRLDPRFEKLKADWQQERANERAHRLEEFKSKIEFLKSQRLLEEEKKAIETLRRFAPNDSEIDLIEYEFKDRWARHLLSQATPADISSRATEKLHDGWRRQMAPHFQPILESALSAVNQYPEMAIDLALMAYFMEFYSEALELLKPAPNSPAKDWLLLELYLETRRFVNALEVIDHLDQKYISDPEANFATALAKAKALWGLGQNNQAIELLISIQNVRPNYRSVSSLLHQWRGGEV